MYLPLKTQTLQQPLQYKKQLQPLCFKNKSFSWKWSILHWKTLVILGDLADVLLVSAEASQMYL